MVPSAERLCDFSGVRCFRDIVRIESDPLRRRVERAVRALLPAGAALEEAA